MKNFNLSNLLIPLLAVAAAYFPLSNMAPSERRSSAAPRPTQTMPPAIATPTPSPKSWPKSSPTTATNPNRVQEEAARLLCDFFGLEPAPDAGSKEHESEKTQRKAQSDARRRFDAESYKGDYC